MEKTVTFSGMTDLLTDYSHYSIQTVSSRPEGVTDKTSVLGVSEVIFRDAKNVGRAVIAPENLAPLSQVEAIRSQRSQIVKDTNMVK